MTHTTLLVEAIQSGTVIDHIPAGQALHIVELLGIKNHPEAVTLGLNLMSKRLGKKDIIKIGGRFLTEAEAGEIAVFAQGARINLIENYKVVNKMIAALPDVLKKILVCPNAHCITRREPIDTLFHVLSARGDVRLSCHYCERVFSREDIREYQI